MAHMAHYKEAHPLPFRITHWINLIAMIALIITGFQIHYPFIPFLAMGVARSIHIFCGFVLLVNMVARVVLAFFVKSAPAAGTRELVKDYKTWLPQADNKHQLLSWVKYYLFIKKEHPISAKLGVPQKLAYLMVPLLILFMFLTGIALWTPTSTAPVAKALIALFGGAMNVRIAHYIGMFIFIMFIMLHVYLATIEGLAPAKLMFFGKEHDGLKYDVDRHVIVEDNNTQQDK